MKASHYLIKTCSFRPGNNACSQSGERRMNAGWLWNEARGAIKYWRGTQRRLNATKELIMATLCHSNAILCALLRPRSEEAGPGVPGRHSFKAIPQVLQHQTQICVRWSIKITNYRTIPTHLPTKKALTTAKRRLYTGLRKSQLGLGKLVISIMRRLLRKVGLIKLKWRKVNILKE